MQTDVLSSTLRELKTFTQKSSDLFNTTRSTQEHELNDLKRKSKKSSTKGKGKSSETDSSSIHQTDIERDSDNESSTGLSSDIDFPEGGMKAWCAVLGSFLGLTNCFGCINSTSAIETYIARNQLNDVSASVVGWIFSIYMCVALLCGILTGDLFDRKGPRLPIFFGGVTSFIGIFITGNCSEIYQFILAFGIVAGLGNALQFSSLVGIIGHYFNKRRGIAIGIATIGGSVGGAIFPIMLRKLYSSLGFAWAMRIFAFVLLFLDIGAFLLITPRFPPKKNPTSNEKLSKKLVGFFKKTLDIDAFKDPRFLFCVLAVTFSEVFLVTSMTYYGSYALFRGNSEDTSYLLITIMNASGIIARAIAGYLSDKIGKFNLMTVMIFFSSVFCLIIWLPFGHLTGGLYAFSVAYGIASAAVLSLTPLCVSQISRVEDFGKKYSTCYFVVAIGTLVGIPISGAFIGANPTVKDYNNFIIFVSVLGFTGVVFWIVSRWFAVKHKFCIY
ncbi:Mch5 protein [Saccharomycopsis crataegensis]|uniref:Mch5 protein n=1 Tax=Saccharomycopsis crataegensis TaxID=43959 RepID=A0AAV5QPB0_9ASCO|nr:Mch5 protein [Saccharomycopsis crataegensis]